MSQDPGSGAPMSERMQSLLSRAVEDQLSEQRQLAGALNDMLAQLNRLGERLDALQPAAGGDAGGTLAAELRESVRLLGERIDGVARLVQERGHDLVEIRGSIGELKAAVAQHTTALGGVTSGLSALPSFGDRIDALQGALGGLHDRLRGLEELTAAANGAFERAEAHDAALRDLRQAFSGVAARVAQLPGREDVEGMVGRLDDPIEALGNRLGRLESALPSVLERLDDIADTIRASGERAEAAGAVTGGSGEPVDSARLEAVESALNDLHDRLGELHEQAADTSSYDGLASRLDELHAGLFGAGGLHEQLSGRNAPRGGGGETDVEAVVAAAVADSEQRLTDHIDEAVLALAEALLRRRARTAGKAASLGAVATPPAPLATDDDEQDEVDEEDEVDDVDAITEFRSGPPAADDDEDDEDEDDEEDEDDDDEEDEDDDDEDDDEGDRPSAPVTEAAAPVVVASEPEGAPRKRKPWWRPGG